jgi:hypothetical protein
MGMAQPVPRITINKNFEGGSLGSVERLGETTFRCHVAGQHNEEGRNRQANWYFFRLDGARGRALTLTLTDFLGEYNGQPACAMSADTIPVFSVDGEHWQHFPAMEWDAQAKEATLRFTPEQDSVYIAHVPPYTHSRLLRLLAEVDACAAARVEVIGKSVLGRDLHLVTVTSPEKPAREKRCVWLMARQHAWEAGTSWVMEGALRFVTSEDAAAQALRAKVTFKFLPMLDPDGCALGHVRFNANQYDLNRHWDEVDLRAKAGLARLPEVWYAKKAIFAWVDAGGAIDLLLYLHNTETAEYMEAEIDDGAKQKLVAALQESLNRKAAFEPSRPPAFQRDSLGTANCLWREKRIPSVLLEQRISASPKLGRRPTIEARLGFGAQLAAQMAEAALADSELR